VSDPLNDPAVRRKLAVLRHVDEVTGNVAMTCRYFGISRQLYYTWLRRYQDEGLDGLRDRSRRPKTCPHATDAEVVEKIVHLRRTYHFGPTKISMYLQRYHDVAVSRSGVWRILKRLGLNRLPASQRYQRRDRKWKRYEKQQPGHRVQIDVKFIEPLTTTAASTTAGSSADSAASSEVRSGRRGKYYQFTAIDDCTRLRVLRIYPQCNQKTAIQFVDYVLDRLPFKVEVIQTDNGAEFQTAFHWHVQDKGIGHVYIKSRTPDSTAKSNAPTASTPKNSTVYSTASSSTTPKYSTTNSKNGKTTTTTTDPTAPSADKHPMKDSARKPTQLSPIYHSRTWPMLSEPVASPPGNDSALTPVGIAHTDYRGCDVYGVPRCSAGWRSARAMNLSPSFDRWCEPIARRHRWIAS